MIEVSNLTKNYNKNRGIEDISFSIPEGEIVGFLGPNGAGKTTTMNIITGYLSADSGTVKVAGIDVLEKPIEAKKHIGYLPEQPPLYHTMTVDEYLGFAYELKGLKPLNRTKQISSICEMTGIADVRRRVIGHLSKGYKQRIGLAQAMLGDPDVLILDEPTIGLDPRQIVEIRNVIGEIGKKRTVILSTHILTEASSVCQRVLVISNGSIVADDKPDTLIGAVSGSRTLVVRAAGSQNKIQSLLRGIDGVQNAEFTGELEPGSCDFTVVSNPSIDIRKPMFAALAQAGYPILMLRPQSSSLEDVFLKLTEDNEAGAKTGKPAKAAAKKKKSAPSAPVKSAPDKVDIEGDE